MAVSQNKTGQQGPQGDAGPAGPPIVNTSSYASPSVITTAITIPADQRARLFVKGSGAVVDPTLGAGSGTQELFLLGCNDTDTIELNTASNLILNGAIVLKDKTQLALHWVSGLNKWVEASRNEI